MDALREVLDAIMADPNQPNCILIIIDPVTAFLGDADAHSAGDIRALLTPVSDLAAEYKIAILSFEEIVARRPDNTNAYYNLATTYWLSGQREKSFAIREKLVRMDQNLANKLEKFYEVYSDTPENE